MWIWLVCIKIWEYDCVFILYQKLRLRKKIETIIVLILSFYYIDNKCKALNLMSFLLV